MDPTKASLGLLRRMPPARLRRHIMDCVQLVGGGTPLLEDLLCSVDPPLRLRTCKTTHQPYILCEYNRDGDSFRSPWSNLYDGGDGTYTPSPSLRKLEEDFNSVFSSYTRAYFGTEGVASSVYLWDLAEDSFAGVVAMHKSAEAADFGVWDSLHVFLAEPTLDDTVFNYSLTSTIVLRAKVVSDGTNFKFAGNVTRVASSVGGAKATHLVNVGNLVQSHENKLRRKVEQVYFAKPSQIAYELRSVATLAVAEAMTAVMVGAPAKKKKKSTLPEGWTKAKDEDGNIYYHNENTGMTQWDVPGSEMSPSSEVKVIVTARPKLTASSTVEDVIAFFACLSLSQDYSEIVMEQQLDGDVILSISESDLESVGMKVFGDRRKILKAIGTAS